MHLTLAEKRAIAALSAAARTATRTTVTVGAKDLRYVTALLARRGIG